MTDFKFGQVDQQVLNWNKPRKLASDFNTSHFHLSSIGNPLRSREGVRHSTPPGLLLQEAGVLYWELSQTLSHSHVRAQQEVDWLLGTTQRIQSIQQSRKLILACKNHTLIVKFALDFTTSAEVVFQQCADMALSLLKGYMVNNGLNSSHNTVLAVLINAINHNNLASSNQVGPKPNLMPRFQYLPCCHDNLDHHLDNILCCVRTSPIRLLRLICPIPSGSVDAIPPQ